MRRGPRYAKTNLIVSYLVPGTCRFQPPELQPDARRLEEPFPGARGDPTFTQLRAHSGTAGLESAEPTFLKPRAGCRLPTGNTVHLGLLWDSRPLSVNRTQTRVQVRVCVPAVRFRKRWPFCKASGIDFSRRFC